MAKQGITVVGYNYKDSAEDARAWLNQFGNPYALIIQDEEGRAALDWGIYGAPETFVIDGQGIVRFKQVGPITEQVVQEQILPLLKDTP
ncbi:MAG TPA: redoxin domain-containing protein, partial [Arenimonas sp.]|nr:redoxin domain-containing protein [Arenimonas sp.]